MGDKERYLLDTNIASYIIKGESTAIRKHLRQTPMADICISAITEAELLFGVARKAEAKQLAMIVREFLLRVETLPWGSDAAAGYAQLRTACERQGKSLGNMDMLIAAHALATGRVLVTNDKAFYHFSAYLTLQDWTDANT